MITLYEQIGADRLRNIVDSFYELVFKNEEIAPLFKNDRHEIAEKQFLFLSQFLGGPQRYSEVHGHPRMRMRHLPHAITPRAKEVWLSCMRQAIDTVISDDKKLADALYNCFPKVAEHMVNR